MSSVRLKILNVLKKGSVTAAVVFLASCSPYGGKAIIKAIEESNLLKNLESRRKEKRKFYVYISRLKKDGLIEVDESVVKKSFKLTNKGRVWLAKHRKYELELSSSIQIVSFDIPEKEREKRDWLREALKNMEFLPAQQSMWIGNRLIPQDFIEDIRILNIYQYLKIFSVAKSGTLKEIEY